MTLFVGNINKNVKGDALRGLFAAFGEVISVKVLMDKETGESKGFAFVDMARESQGLEAIRKLTNAEFFGKKLVVNKARPKPEMYFK